MKPVAEIDLQRENEQLKKLLKISEANAEALEKSLGESGNILKNKTLKIEQLEEVIRFLKHLKFGRSSEKFDNKQHDLFNEAEEIVELEEASASDFTETLVPEHTVKTPKHKSRTLQNLPKDIPRNEVEHDLGEAEKMCNCGCKMTRCGSERSEVLEVVPPQFSVTVNVRHTYACQSCEGQLKTAKKPPQVIEKSFSSPSLLAYIIVSKYLYALPLYRQEKIYKSLKVPLKRNTMANWVIRCGDLIQPLLERFEFFLLRDDYLQVDETRLQVLNEPDRDPSKLSQMWVRRSTGDTPIILFDYSPSRSGVQACTLLKNFSGYLQTDDYAGYNRVVKANGLTQLGCNAHARRKFDEAKKSEPVKNKPSNKSPSGAELGLMYYKKLYKIEKDIKHLSESERFRIRLEKSVPLMKKFVSWAEKTLLNTPKSVKLGIALKYLVKNQEKLIQYCGHGKLHIDNNFAEGAIRPYVIGRKNWLFSDSAKGAKASAALYSLIETAKANDLNIFDYLSHLFTVLPNSSSNDELDTLLPWNVTLPD